MRHLITVLISCGLAVSIWLEGAHSALPSPPPGEKPTRQEIVGAWHLVSIDYSGPNGALADPVFGPNPQGIIIYEQSGWMSVQIVTANRPVMTRQLTRTSGVLTAEDAMVAAAAFNTYYAYFGTWDYDADTSVITHHLSSSLLPYEIGLEYRREATFDGVRLKLIARSQVGGEERQRTLVWTRDAGLSATQSTTLSVGQQHSASADSGTPLTPAASSPPAPTPGSRPPNPAPGSATKYGDIPTDYENAIRRYLRVRLKYPDAVQYQEISKPEQGYTTGIRGTFLMREKREYGWIVKATINAKNSNNSYVGFKTYTFLFRGEKIVNTRSPLPGNELMTSQAGQE